jgi:MFS family permease
MVVWSLFQAAGGIAGSYFQLMLARIGLGATEAPCFPSATRSTSDWFDVKDRGKPSGLYTSGAYIGPTIAPPILTGLMLAYNWRVMFIVMGVGRGRRGRVLVPHLPRPAAQELDAQDEVYLRQTARPKSAVSLREWTALFRFKAMWVLMLGAFCTGYITWMYQTWLPAYLEMQQHISIAKTGFLASVPLICAFFGALSGGWLSDWLHARHGAGQEPPPAADPRPPAAVSAAFTGLAAIGDDAGAGDHLHRRVDVLHAVRHHLQMDPGDRGDAAGLLRLGREQPEFRRVPRRHLLADPDRVHRRPDRLVRRGAGRSARSSR